MAIFKTLILLPSLLVLLSCSPQSEYSASTPQPEYSASTPPQPSPDPALEASVIESLYKIAEQHQFSNFIDSWETGYGFFLPIAAWNDFSTEERNNIIDLAKQYRMTGIVVGRTVPDKNEIFLDDVVFENVYIPETEVYDPELVKNAFRNAELLLFQIDYTQSLFYREHGTFGTLAQLIQFDKNEHEEVPSLTLESKVAEISDYYTLTEDLSHSEVVIYRLNPKNEYMRARVQVLYPSDRTLRYMHSTVCIGRSRGDIPGLPYPNDPDYGKPAEFLCAENSLKVDY